MGDFDQTLPVTDVKNRLLELLKELQELRGSIAITKNGVPAGVLMSINEYEGLLETIEILSNPDTIDALNESHQQAARGKLIPHNQAWKK